MGKSITNKILKFVKIGRYVQDICPGSLKIRVSLYSTSDPKIMSTPGLQTASTITFKVERVPAVTRNQFKSACAADGLNMRDVVIPFMTQYGQFSAACSAEGLNALEVLTKMMQQFAEQQTSEAA